MPVLEINKLYIYYKPKRESDFTLSFRFIVYSFNLIGNSLY
ncbi:hypothetical protein BOVAC1_1903 [Bacteroides ovatus]|nr:hypothetical protein BOVAC1_1903 [Bacteroides ovatus]